MTATLVDKFRRGSATYKCENCGKQTRNTGRGEVDGFCWTCTNAMMLENEHSDDGHPEPVDGCPTCEAEKAEQEKATASPLLQQSPGEYLLKGEGVWVRVKNLVVRIRRHTNQGEPGVEAVVYSNKNVNGASLGCCFASFAEAKEYGGQPQKLDIVASENGCLVKEGESPEDYALRNDEPSVWIGADEIDVYVVCADEGVAVDLFSHTSDDYGDPISSTWVLFMEANDQPDSHLEADYEDHVSGSDLE